MPRYFFDIQDGKSSQTDDEGKVFGDDAGARKAAMRILPDIARDEIARLGNDHVTFTVAVWHENGRAIYCASLTYAGVSLNGVSRIATS